MRNVRYLMVGALMVGATLAGVEMLAPSSPARADVSTSVGTFKPVGPNRLLDTRDPAGSRPGVVGPNETVHLQVAGKGDVPLTGASAVVLNVTETASTAASFITVAPSGLKQRPTASNLNFGAHTTLANSVTVQLGPDGGVDIFNSLGDIQLIVDVDGYFIGDSSLPIAGQYQLVNPQRILDTRKTGVVPAGKEITVGVNYGGVINPHIRALAVNITSVGSSAPGFVTVWSGQGSVPTASTLNFAKGATTPNMAIVPTSTCSLAPCSGLPSITIYNGSSGSTHLLVDVFGVFDDGTLAGGMLFHPIAPDRIIDTRSISGGALAGGKTDNVAPPADILTTKTRALAVNVTAVSPTSATYMTLWPSGVVLPTVSTLNPAAKQTVANAAILTLGDYHKFSVWNASGSTNFIVDVAGTYELAQSSGANSVSPFSAATSTAK